MRHLLHALFLSGVSLSLAWPAARAQAVAPPTFDVATIKLSKDPTGNSSGISTERGELSAKNVTLKRCIMGAYGIGPHQLLGGPDWIGSTRFDIEAKGDPSIDSDDALMDMLQRLLAERFALKLHHEERPMRAYSLEVAKTGLKIKPGADGEAVTNTSSSNTSKSLDAGHVSLDLLAKVLARETSLPIVNNTGLAGFYSFKLRWTPDKARQPDREAEDYGALPDALTEQLGLHLRVATLPVGSLVIDAVNPPTAN